MRWLEKVMSSDQGKNPLSRTGLLASLTPGELGIVQSFLHERSFMPGEVIFDQGEEGQALYFVLSGCVLICHPGMSAQPIAELAAGDFFGELGLIDNWPRSAQAMAGTASEIAVLFRGDFERLMDSHARIAAKISFQLARYLGQRLRDMVARQHGGAATV